MAGNVWEWCEDWYDTEEKQIRVVRGGSWGNVAWGARAAFRYWFAPDGRDDSIGFRVVCGVRTS